MERAKLIIREEQGSQKTYTVVIDGTEEEVFNDYGEAIAYIEDLGFDQSQIEVLDDT